MFHDRTFNFENSSNGRIRMENPFLRNLNEKKVFPMINASEISKFIKSQLYLETRLIDSDAKVGLHPEIESSKLFMQELLCGVKKPKVKLTNLLNSEYLDQHHYVYKHLPFKRLDDNLKDENFISCMETDPLNIKFTYLWKQYDR